jgi:hypothetical protein
LKKSSKKSNKTSWVLWHTSVIPALKRLREQDGPVGETLSQKEATRQRQIKGKEVRHGGSFL